MNKVTSGNPSDRLQEVRNKLAVQNSKDPLKGDRIKGALKSVGQKVMSAIISWNTGR